MSHSQKLNSSIPSNTEFSSEMIAQARVRLEHPTWQHCACFHEAHCSLELDLYEQIIFIRNEISVTK